MDFFERQERARRNTKVLVLYFALAVLGTTAAIYLAFALILLRGGYQAGSLRWLWNTQLFLGVAAGTWLVILLGSLMKTAQLGKAGSAVALLLGGRPVNPLAAGPDERKLLNVVEEMSIASGTPVPEVYLLGEEKSINAFAAGTTPKNAAIGVTRGCIQLLNRDELQGVIAHEFSHILNGDMRLNLRLMGLIHGILCIAIIGRELLRASSRRRSTLGARSSGKGGNPLPLIGLALMIIGSIGVFFGRLIKSAVSRQREFLADAAAVQFTRNPDGIGGALKKIGGLEYGSRLQAGRAEEASHMFFGNGLGQPWFGLMATHPPLEERIRAIDPHFDGKFTPVTLPGECELEGEPVPILPRRARGPMRAPDLGDLLGPAASGAAMPPPVLLATEVTARTGAVNAGHLRSAEKLLAALPEPLFLAAHEPMEAIALVYALGLSGNEKVRGEQLALLPEAIRTEVGRLCPHLDGIDPRAKLPLVELAFPALRRLSPAQFTEFSRTLRGLIEVDREIDLFEFALQRMVVRHLEPQFQAKRKSVTQFYSLKPLLPQCAVLVSALANVGHDTPAEIERAFRAGIQPLGRDAAGLTLLPLSECNLLQIDAALTRLAQATPPIKKIALEACAQAVAADGKIQMPEGELLRAIADSLDCPMPPFVAE
jgi:Zn-dependent protease with chaperone function